MSGYTKVAGTWRRYAPWARTSGTWTRAKEGYVRNAGVWKQWWLDGGVNDRTFNTANNTALFNGQVGKALVESDGQIVVGGAFTTFNGVTVNRIVRLNADGTRDTTFTSNTGTAFNGTVERGVIQSDGKIVLVGAFTTFNGATVNYLVRLNADGTRDTTFTTNNGTGANGSISSVALQSDGKIVLGGSFTTFNGATVNRIVRLNADGTRDTAFTTNTGTGATAAPDVLLVQSDAKIVVAGAFTTFNGVATNYILRLNADGTRDSTFSTNNGTGPNNRVWAGALQSDQKIVLAGDFTTFNGTTVNRIVRLNTDGTRDTVFTTNTGTGSSNRLWEATVQSDNKILLASSSAGQTFNGSSFTYMLRLNSDGTRDTGFTIGTGPDNVINYITVQTDGKIITTGAFTNFSGVPVNYISRRNSDGTRDTSFPVINGAAGLSGSAAIVYDLAAQSDGKILLAGTLLTYNATVVNRIARANTDGSHDTAFTTNTGTGASGIAYAVAVQSDGKILLGGNFATFNGATVNYLVRLNSDGTRDTAFTTNNGTGFFGAIASDVRALATQSDGKIVVGGQFTSFNGATVNYLVRLNSTGTRDTAFTTNNGTGANGSVFTLAVQSDGKILVGGGFATFNGVTVNRIVRLNSDGTRDTAFTTNTGTAFNGTVNSIAIQSDGKILVGGSFTTFNGATVNYLVRLNADGTRDTTFTTNNGTGPANTVTKVAVQGDGKILVCGTFTTFNGVTVNRIVRLNTDGTRDTAFTTNAGTAADSAVHAALVRSNLKVVIGGNFTSFNSIIRHGVACIGGE